MVRAAELRHARSSCPLSPAPSSQIRGHHARVEREDGGAKEAGHHKETGAGPGRRPGDHAEADRQPASRCRAAHPPHAEGERASRKGQPAAVQGQGAP
eukprot:10142929-Heterocapsa_arctica.AAC.1